MGRRSGVQDLIAIHRDAAAARSSIEALSRAGVDGGAISLLAAGDEMPLSRHAVRTSDGGASSRLGGVSVRGAVIGAIVGAAFGAVLVGFVAGSMTAIAAGILGGAVAGAGLGALTGLMGLPTMAPAWERSFAPLRPGSVIVAVRNTSDDELTRAQAALEGTEAFELRRVRDIDDVPAEPVEAD